MKAVISMLFFAAALAAASSDGQAEKEVLAVLETWKQAMLHNDSASMEKILHKDLTYTHSSGQEMNKAQKLTAVADTKTTKIKAIEFSDTSVRIYGETAILKANAAVTSLSTGSPVTSHIIILHVLLKTPQGWQLVARQATKAGR